MSYHRDMVGAMTTLFAGKAKPLPDKLRGGYYTPEPIATFLSDWVAGAGPVLLEPSCGDGAILNKLTAHGEPVGVELFEDEASKARIASGVDVMVEDFFTWFTPNRYGQFDGVAGNPPYIRFGNWAVQYREPALELMRAEGLHPTRLTNAWVPFVVGSIAAVRKGGRVALVLPAELLQVGYAAELRAYLVDSCTEITVVSFSELVFPGILQEVVLFLGIKGNGPAQIRTIEVPNAAYLNEVTLNGAAVRAPLHESEKWTKYFLQVDEIESLRKLRASAALLPLGTYASVNVGVVTGRNSFFCLTEEQEANWELAEYTVNLLSRSAQFTGVRYLAEDFQEQARGGSKSRLLAVPADLALDEHSRLARYVKLGESEEVHLGYKCSIRPKWWSVPSVSVPDGFMLRQVSTVLRLSSNHAGATSTDTVHRVFTREGIDMDKLAVAAFNSITLAMAEIMGRSYGGGLLEVEPRECVELPVPDPEHVSPELVRRVDELIRVGRLDEAIEEVDQCVLVEAAGFSEGDVADAKSAARNLRERRLKRGRRPKLA